MQRAALALLLLLSLPEALAQTLSEEIDVRIIDVDVVVTDKHGQPLTGLKREDFEILENGKPVAIRYFTPVSEPVRATPEPIMPQAVPVTWVVFVDQTNMQPGPRNRALDSLRRFIETSLAPGDRGIIAVNDGQALRVPQNMTTDRQVLMGALAKLEKDRVHQGPAALRTSQIRHDIREAEPVAAPGSDFVPRDKEAEYIAQNLGHQINMIMEEEVHRTRNAIRSISTFVETLATVDGRLALVYVGAGFNTIPAEDLIETWRSKYPTLTRTSADPDPEQHKRSLEDEVDRLFANLSATRVAVYTLYASTLAGASVQDGGPNVMDIDNVAGSRSQITETMIARQMADRTGGRFFTINPDLVKQLASARSDLSHYYSLGYVPTGPPGDARRIVVRVKNQDVRVRHRDTVRERTRTEEAGRAAVAAVVQPPTKSTARKVEVHDAPAPVADEANPLGVQVEAAQPRRDGWGTDHLLPFDLKLGSMTFVPRGSVYRAEFVLHFALVEPNGTVWPLETRDHSLEIPSAEVPKAAEQYTSFVWHVDLAPLRIAKDIPIKTPGLKLLVTVEDRASRRRSVLTIPVQKPGQPYFPGDD